MENQPVEKEMLDALLQRVQGTPRATAAAPFEDLDGPGGGQEPEARRPRQELLRGVHLRVRAELGRARLLLKETLQLGPGAIIDLDKLTEDPVDLFVNDLLVARGEILVINDSFCIRIIEVFSPRDEEQP